MFEIICKANLLDNAAKCYDCLHGLEICLQIYHKITENKIFGATYDFKTYFRQVKFQNNGNLGNYK